MIVDDRMGTPLPTASDSMGRGVFTENATTTPNISEVNMSAAFETVPLRF